MFREAFNKFWNNKFYYKVISCRLFLLIHTAMHESMNIKNPVIRIFCVSGWLVVQVSPGKWSYNLYEYPEEWVRDRIILLLMASRPVRPFRCREISGLP